jgi:hypothetical protein
MGYPTSSIASERAAHGAQCVIDLVPVGHVGDSLVARGALLIAVGAVFQIGQKTPHDPRVLIAIQRDRTVRVHTIPQLDADAQTPDSVCIIDLAAPGHGGVQSSFVNLDPLVPDPSNKTVAGERSLPRMEQLENEGVVERRGDVPGEVHIALLHHPRLLSVRWMLALLCGPEFLARQEHLPQLFGFGDVAENSSADFGREEEKHFGSGMCGGVVVI